MAKPLRFIENIVDRFKNKEIKEFDVEFDSRISKLHGILDEQRLEEKSKSNLSNSSRVNYLDKSIVKKEVLKKNVDFVSKKQFDLAIKKLSSDFENKVTDSNVLITKDHKAQNKLNVKEKKIAENIDKLDLLMDKLNIDDVHTRLNSVEKFTKEIKKGVKFNKQNVAHIDTDILNKFDVLILDLETRHNKSNKDIKKIEKKLSDFKSDISNKNIDARMRVVESYSKKLDKKVGNKLDKINDLLDVTRKSIVVDKKNHEKLLNKKVDAVMSDYDSFKSQLQTLSGKLDAVSVDSGAEKVDERLNAIEMLINRFDEKIDSELKKMNKFSVDTNKSTVDVGKKTEMLLNKKIDVVVSDFDLLKSDLQTLSGKLDAVSVDSGAENVDERLNAIEMLINRFDEKIETKLLSKTKSMNDKIIFFETETNKSVKKTDTKLVSFEKKLTNSIDLFGVENKKIGSIVNKNASDLKKVIGVVISKLDDVIDKENNLFLMTRAELEDTRKIESACVLKQKDLAKKISSFSMSSLSETNNLKSDIKKIGELESKLDLKVSGLSDGVRDNFNFENRLPDFNDLEKSKPIVAVKNDVPVLEKNDVIDESAGTLNKIGLDLKLITKISMLILEIDNLLDENAITISDGLNQKKHELSKLAELISDSDSSLINSLSLSLYLITLDIDKMDVVKVKEEIMKSRALLGCNAN